MKRGFPFFDGRPRYAVHGAISRAPAFQKLDQDEMKTADSRPRESGVTRPGFDAWVGSLRVPAEQSWWGANTLDLEILKLSGQVCLLALCWIL